jgi:hypothetical protein
MKERTMSRSVELFICSPDPLDAVARTVASATGFKVDPGESGVWIVRDGEVRAVLGEHRYTDEELPLSRYRYAMSAEVNDGIRLQDSPPVALLRRVVETLQGKPEWMTLLVLDMQYRGAAAKPPPGTAAAPEVPETPANREVPA